jgi:hypothetical protein
VHSARQSWCRKACIDILNDAYPREYSSHVTLWEASQFTVGSLVTACLDEKQDDRQIHVNT